MARYDRIAPLSPPSRAEAFPGWLVLRDIEGNDRDVELARRARLRFLALRPVRRLLTRGATAVPRESYLAQIEGVREELGYLPTRDAERGRIARFLHQIEDRDVARIVTASLELADACAAAGQLFGAEEYALTALGLAEEISDDRLQSSSYVMLARIARLRGETADVKSCVEKAVYFAKRSNDHLLFVRALAEIALDHAAQGQGDAARDVMNEVITQMRSANEMPAVALAQARLCACENTLGNAAAALEQGWAALRQVEDVRERAHLVEQLGIAFSSLDAHKAAERCFAMLAQRGVDPGLRARARAGHALQSVVLGSPQVFRERRSMLLNDASEWSADPRLNTFVHIELGRGCVIAEDVDDAREHLREAINTARRFNFNDLLASAEEVLSALEQNSKQQLLKIAGPAGIDAARRIAEQLETLPDLAVTAG